MRTEWKICLPCYKMGYALFAVVILSFVRGVSSACEVGIALEGPRALLAVVFCGETYVQEITAGRWEIQRLYPIRNRVCSVGRRMLLQETFLLLLALSSFWLFLLVQRPRDMEEVPRLFVAYGLTVWVTVIFWGILSHTLSCLFRSQWVGMALCLLLWICTNSSSGDRLFGKWNLFSYTFHGLGKATGAGNGGSFDWLCGKLLCLILSGLMMAGMSRLLKKR